MKKTHGGARPGAGRPPKDRTPQGGEVEIQNAEHYLELVVTGKIVPDSLRVQAARSLIQYQQPKRRAPKPSPSPKELVKKSARAEDKAMREEFQRKAAEVRERYANAEK